MSGSDDDSWQDSISDSGLAMLLEKARSGSGSGLGVLLQAFHPLLMEMADQKLGNRLRRRMSSSDLVQETLLTAGKQFASFRGSDPDAFRRWMRELFHSRLVDGIRRHQIAEMRRQNLEDEATALSGVEDSGPTPSVMAIRNEDARRLFQALQTLPEETQRILHMRYSEDRTFEQIAESMNLSISRVWRLFHAAAEEVDRFLRGGGA